MEGMVERVKSEMRECPGVEKMTNKLRRGEGKKSEGKQDKRAEMQQGILGEGRTSRDGWVKGGGGAGDDATSSVPLLLNLSLNYEQTPALQHKICSPLWDDGAL